MSIWIVQSPFSAEQEQNLAQQQELPLPFEGLPDLSGIRSDGEMRQLLLALNPDLPPETLYRLAELHWTRYHHCQRGDVLLLLHRHHGVASIAEIIAPYRYQVFEGKDHHTAEIRWLKTRSLRRLVASLKPILLDHNPMQLLEDADTRKQIYNLIQRPYNRLVKWQWILVLLMVMQAVVMIVGMIRANVSN